LTDSVPEAINVSKSRFSIVWIIPLLALMLGGWLTYEYLQEKGTVVQIEFRSADGLSAGKTKIKYKDVEVGIVDDISFSRNLSSVIVTATITSNMRKHLNPETRFWVVRARVAAGEVTGLGTLLSGAYIGMEPGESKEKIQKSFKGLDKPPLLFIEDHGTLYTLSTDTLASFEAGAPIYYRRFRVGEVLSYTLNKLGTEFSIEIFVKAPYDQLIFENTQFWNASGIDVKLSADGFEMQTESMITLLLGGLAFDNLEKEKGPQAQAGTQFTLYDNRQAAANAEHTKESQQYRLYFDSSARGLSVGAPVTVRGIPFGRVTDVALEYDLRDKSFKVPVTFESERHRLVIVGKKSADDTPPTAADLVSHGLRAQLRSGNLLTGQMLIDFDVYPDAEPVEVRYEGEYIVLPTIATSLDSIKHSLFDLMGKLGKMPLDEIGINLNNILKGADELIHSDDVSDILASINQASAQLNSSAEGLNALINSTDVETILRNFSQASVQINSSAEGIDTLVRSADVKAILSNINQASVQLKQTLVQANEVTAGLTEDSTVYQEVLRTLRELSGAARSLRQMAEVLERNPEALLKGKPR
jgi:paraquat-inducible protein B